MQKKSLEKQLYKKCKSEHRMNAIPLSTRYEITLEELTLLKSIDQSIIADFGVLILSNKNKTVMNLKFSLKSFKEVNCI